MRQLVPGLTCPSTVASCPWSRPAQAILCARRARHCGAAPFLPTDHWPRTDSRSPPPAVAEFRIDDAVSRPAVLMKFDDGCRGQFGHFAHRLSVGAGDVRTQDDIGEPKEGVAGLGRLLIEHVQTGRGQMARGQGVAQVRLDDQAAP